MVGRESITFKQLLHLTVTLVLATAILYLPAITLEDAGNGGWLSPALSMLVGMGVVLIVSAMGQQYTDKTLTQYLPELLGTFTGKILGFIYGLFFFSNGLLVVRELTEFVHQAALPKTPELVADVVVYGTLMYTLYCGLEGIARVNEMVYVTLIFLFLILFLGLFGPGHVSAFFPLLDQGWMGVIRGAVVPGSWFAEVVLIAMLLPSVKMTGKSTYRLLCSILLIGVLLMVSTAVVIGVLGATEGARASLPTLEVVKYIQWGTFFQHIDTLFLLPWLSAMIIKIMLFYYSGLLSLAQTLKVSQWQALIVPLCILSIVLNRWLFRTEGDLKSYIFVVFPLYAYILQLVIPFMLLVVYWLRYGRKKRGNVG